MATSSNRNAIRTFVFAFLLISSMCNAQSPRWQWARSFVGPGVLRANATDSKGNIVVAGSYSRGMTLDDFKLTPSNTQFGDALVAKLDPTGKVLWARGLGGAATDEAWRITTDRDDNVIVLGVTQSLTVAIGKLAVTNPSGFQGPYVLFVAKFDSDGNELWVRQSTSAANSIFTPHDVAADKDGNIAFSAGYADEEVSFGSVRVKKNGRVGVSSVAQLVVKYDAMGNVLWGRSTSPFTDCGALTIDEQSNVIITNEFVSESITIGGVELKATSTYADVFIAKYDPQGSLLWAKNLHGESSENVDAISTDSKSSIYITGYTTGNSLAWGNVEAMDTSQGNQRKPYIFKIDAVGNGLWGNIYGNKTDQYFYGVVNDKEDNVYIRAGGLGDSVMIGPELLIKPKQSGNMLYVAKCNPSGKIMWVKSAPGSSSQIGGIDVDQQGAVVVCGHFIYQDMMFDDIVLKKSQYDVFVAKLSGSTGTDVSESALLDETNVYRNPASQELVIENLPVDVSVCMVDIMGRCVYTTNTQERSIGIDLSDRAPGMYLVLIETRRGRVVKSTLIVR